MPNTIAFDLGNYTMKALVAKPGRQLNLLRSVEVFNPLGLSLAGDETAATKLGELIGNTFTDHQLPRTDVRLSLPETLVTTKIISIPPLSDAELASAINWQAEQHIPIPLDELSLEYQVVYRPARNARNEQMRVLLVGARKSVIDAYLDPFYRAGIEVSVLETQTLSILRSMQFTPEDPTTLVVHTGATHTNLAIVHHGELRFVYSYNHGGQLFTRTIEQAIQLDGKQAEQYKRTYGLDAAQLQGKLREVLLPAVRAYVIEMQKAIQFFSTQPDAEPVKRLVLSGGSAQLPGLVQFIIEQFGTEVFVAAPFTGAQGEVPQVNHPVFTVCVGLLQRENVS